MEWIVDKCINLDLVLLGVKMMIMFGVNYWLGVEVGVKVFVKENENVCGEGGFVLVWVWYVLYVDYYDMIKLVFVEVGKVLEELYV